MATKTELQIRRIKADPAISKAEERRAVNRLRDKFLSQQKTHAFNTMKHIQFILPPKFGPSVFTCLSASVCCPFSLTAETASATESGVLDEVLLAVNVYSAMYADVSPP